MLYFYYLTCYFFTWMWSLELKIAHALEKLQFSFCGFKWNKQINSFKSFKSLDEPCNYTLLDILFLKQH